MSAYFIENYINHNAALAEKTCPREMQSNIDEEIAREMAFEIFKGWFREYYNTNPFFNFDTFETLLRVSSILLVNI